MLYVLLLLISALAIWCCTQAQSSTTSPSFLSDLENTLAMNGTLASLASAIQQFEGWFPGSVSYRNNNPGNLKYLGQAGALGADPRGFAVFDSFDSGWQALLDLLAHYRAYYPNWTLLDLMNVYAPARDNNNPSAYANFIAQQAGIAMDTTLKELA